MQTGVIGHGEDWSMNPNNVGGGLRFYEFQLGRDLDSTGRLATIWATGDPTSATCEVSAQAIAQGA